MEKSKLKGVGGVARFCSSSPAGEAAGRIPRE